MGTRRYVLLSTAVFAVTIVISIVGWNQLSPSSEVPIHFGMDGVTRRVGRTEAALSTPLVMLGVFVLGLVLTPLEKQNKGEWTRTVILGCLMFSTAIHTAILAGPSLPDRVLPAVVGVGSGVLLLAIAIILKANPGTSLLFGVRVSSIKNKASLSAARITAIRGFLWVGGTMIVAGWVFPIWATSVTITIGLSVVYIVSARAANRINN